MRHWLRWGLGGCAWLVLLVAVGVAPASVAPSSAASGKPFILPFANAAGPNTWLLGQLYGNTTGAFGQRDTIYRAGQGLHFGIDLSAPCGTPVIAIGDGVVTMVDAASHGSLPHNLLLKLDAGYTALYGHLLERPKLNVGQRVAKGQTLALSGDSFGTCHSAPHLHLEIRDLSYTVAFNPVELIEADWDSLALVGAYQRGFQRDLNDPRRWQYPDDQPDTHFGGALLNDYALPWPPDWTRGR